MRKIRGWLVRLAGLFWKGDTDQKLEDELQSHVDMHTEDNLRLGMTPVEARRQALIMLGSVEATKEAYRDQRGIGWAENFFQDSCFAIRQLRKNPGFAIVVLLTLAVGIGANTAIFSRLNAVLFKPLPYPSPQQLISLTDQHQKGFIRATSFPNFSDWRDQNIVLQDIAAMSGAAYNLVGNGEPERVPAQRVTAGFFRVLGVKPFMGRWFLDEEDKANAQKVAIISYGLWQRRFSASPTIVGQPLNLDGEAYTVVGVMPSGFLPIGGGRFLSLDEACQLWVPLATDESRSTRGKVFLRVIGRLRPGVSILAASSNFNVIAKRLAEQFPAEDSGFGIRLRAVDEDLHENTAPALLLLMGADLLLLMMVCANVGNLFLIRAMLRGGEMTLRAALGAGRLRIVRQALTESAILALSGGVLGTMLGWGTAHVLQKVRPIPLQGPELNLTVLIFTLGISLLAGLSFGLAPAFHCAKVNLNDVLKSTAKGTAGSKTGRLRNCFVIAEVALAFMLLASAGVVIKSLGLLLRVNPGFRADRVLTMRIQLTDARYDASSKAVNFFSELLEKMAALPGVETVGAVTDLPMSGRISTMDFTIDGRSQPTENRNYTDFQTTSADYFRAMGIPLIRGRFFNNQDRENAPLVAIINQQMAAQFWPGEDPISQRLRIDGSSYEIVGVVGAVRHFGLGADARPETYVNYEQHVARSMMIAVRTATPGTTLFRAISAQLMQLDPSVPLSEPRTLAAVVASSTSNSRFLAFLLGSFATVALLLAALGLYGVISYSVANRIREIGIRMALGAQISDVTRMILKQALLLVLGGLSIGLLSTLAFGRVLSGMLYQVKASDPVTFLLVSASLVMVALIAVLMPALRAARVQPASALRHE